LFKRDKLIYDFKDFFEKKNVLSFFLQNFESIHFKYFFSCVFLKIFLKTTYKYIYEKTNCFLSYSFRKSIIIMKGSRVCIAITFDENLNWNSFIFSRRILTSQYQPASFFFVKKVFLAKIDMIEHSNISLKNFKIMDLQNYGNCVHCKTKADKNFADLIKKFSGF